MIFESFDIEILSPLQSLVVVLGTLAGGIGLSLWENNNNEKSEEVVDQ